jgi:hypothetical protein
MAGEPDRDFQHFQAVSEDRTDNDVIWDDQFIGPKAVRLPTRAEKISIILVGVAAIGFIILMAVTIIVAIYISRR